MEKILLDTDIGGDIDDDIRLICLDILASTLNGKTEV